MTSNAQKVRAAVASGCAAADTISRWTGLSAGEVSVAVAELTAAGVVEQCAGGYRLTA